MRRKIKIAYFILFLLSFMLFVSKPIPVLANNISSVEMQMVIHEDGYARITETWDITMTNSSNTEWYVAKYDLDNMLILDLKVEEIASDGSLIPFETLDYWDVDASRSEKAGKCGLVRTNDGYEVCWGFGELGNHKYIVSYTLTDVVKGYEGGDAMSYNFLSQASGGVGTFDIMISSDHINFEFPDTRVWVYGYEAESSFSNGEIIIENQGYYSENDYSAVLLVFEPGLLSPDDVRSDNIEDIIELNMRGSIWEEDHSSDDELESSSTDAHKSDGSSIFTTVMFVFFLIIILSLSIIPVFLINLMGKRKKDQFTVPSPPKKEDIPYCRDIPFDGDISAAYAVLMKTDRKNEGAIIGCFILEWLRTHQVEMIKHTAGLLIKREVDAIKLNRPQPGMPVMQKELYDMFVAAAGNDSILQEKEFEKWAQKNYSKVGSWFSQYRRLGEKALCEKKATETFSVPHRGIFGRIHHRSQTNITPLGEDLIKAMWGFKYYLLDFTIINEREAREVHLWHHYLVFAQLFKIADKVAKQFKQLYPEFFTEEFGRIDLEAACVFSTVFAASMVSGYTNGVNAANASSSSGGGGGSSSSGGGGGASGGGGAGGR